MALWLIVALGLAFMPRLQAAETTGATEGDVRKSVEAPAEGVVEIDQVTGTVVVSGWDRSEVEVTGRLGRNLDSVLLEPRGDRVLLRMRQSLQGGGAADLSIRIPRGARLEVESMSLDLRVTGVLGGVDSNIVSGTQRLTGAGAESGSVRLETVSGVLQVDGILSELELMAVSGPVGVDAAVDRLRVDTVNGPQDLRLRDARRVDVNSLNGAIVLQLASPSPRLVVAGKTFNGSLTLGFDAEVSAHIEAVAQHGRIENRLGGDEKRSGEGEHDPARIAVSTYRGDIVLRPLR